MSMHHKLKIWPQYYCRVANGTKTFEVRNNDRGFQPGDTVELMEYDPTPIEKNGPHPSIEMLHSLSPRHMAETGFTEKPHLFRTVGYVHQLDATRVVFSLLPYEVK